MTTVSMRHLTSSAAHHSPLASPDRTAAAPPPSPLAPSNPPFTARCMASRSVEPQASRPTIGPPVSAISRLANVWATTPLPLPVARVLWLWCTTPSVAARPLPPAASVASPAAPATASRRTRPLSPPPPAASRPTTPSGCQSLRYARVPSSSAATTALKRFAALAAPRRPLMRSLTLPMPMPVCLTRPLRRPLRLVRPAPPAPP